MSVPYTRTTWVDDDGSGNGTLFTAARANNIEGQLVTLSAINFPASTPTYVGPGISFAVAAQTQVLFSFPIDVDGELAIDGVLVEV